MTTLDGRFQEQIWVAIDDVSAAMWPIRRTTLGHNTFRYLAGSSRGSLLAEVAPHQRIEKSGQLIAIVAGATCLRARRACSVALRISVQALRHRTLLHVYCTVDTKNGSDLHVLVVPAGFEPATFRV